jgi:ribose/xylose/arabinose/galactoside ABC-type transport system permease subunit
MKRKFRFTFNMALLLILIALFTGIALLNPVFLSFDYLIGVMLRNIVEIGVMSLTMTLIVITGGIDLSVGSTMVLSSMLGGMAALKYGGAVGVLMTMLVGAACGLFNGLLIARIKISPLVTTLATMYLYMGVARSLSHGDSVYAFDWSQWLGTEDPLGVPVQILFYAVLALVFWFLLHRTAMGRRLYAIGLNENATRFCGIDTARVKMQIYLFSGLMCAFAGLIWLGRFTSIKYDAGTSLGLRVVTVVVLGGTSILGGRGDMLGTILATMIIAVLNSGLNVLAIPIDAQTIVQGTILVISLVCYSSFDIRARKSRILKVPVEHEPGTPART